MTNTGCGEKMSKKVRPVYPGSLPLFHELVEWQRNGSLYLAVAKSGEYALHWAMTDDYVSEVKQGILKTYDACPDTCPVADKVALTLVGDRIFYRCTKGAEITNIGAVTMGAARKALSDLAALVGPGNVVRLKGKG